MTRPAAVIVQQGNVLDYVDEVTQRKETPEEYVRQEIGKLAELEINSFLHPGGLSTRAEDVTRLCSWTQRAR